MFDNEQLNQYRIIIGDSVAFTGLLSIDKLKYFLCLYTYYLLLCFVSQHT